MKKLLSIIVGCLMMCGVVGQAQAIFIDNGSYTTITELNMDVYDVYEFVGLTHQEVLNKVKTLGDGWFLASMDDVRPIFQLITEEKYVNTVKDMIGFNVLSPFGVALYNTGGRVKDTYPDSSYPNYNYLWGFGNGIQLYRADLQQVTYIWSTFGIGWDLADTRFDTMGAWVIRKSTSCYTHTQLVQAITEERLKWDANGDGKIGLEDIIRMLQVIAGLRP